MVTTVPLKSGMHFKAPFITVVDKMQVSRTALHLKPFVVNTVDNQQITLDINLQYEIPEEGVFHLLYGVGKSGMADITDSVTAVVQAKTALVFSSKNTNFLTGQLENIQLELYRSISEVLKAQFKINVDSVQIAEIRYSDTFVKSNNAAVDSKNMAIKEENQKKVVEYQAQQKVIEAEGRAREAAATAEGEKAARIIEAEGKLKSAEATAQATVILAEAEAKAAEIQGRGQASKLKQEIDSVGGTEKYLELLTRQAYKNWDGKLPVWTTSKDGGFLANVTPPKN